MQNKLRHEYKLNVPRDLVHYVMFDLDPDGLVRCVWFETPMKHWTEAFPR